MESDNKIQQSVYRDNHETQEMRKDNKIGKEFINEHKDQKHYQFTHKKPSENNISDNSFSTPQGSLRHVENVCSNTWFTFLQGAGVLPQKRNNRSSSENDKHGSIASNKLSNQSYTGEKRRHSTEFNTSLNAKMSCLPGKSQNNFSPNSQMAFNKSASYLCSSNVNSHGSDAKIDSLPKSCPPNKLLPVEMPLFRTVIEHRWFPTVKENNQGSFPELDPRLDPDRIAKRKQRTNIDVLKRVEWANISNAKYFSPTAPKNYVKPHSHSLSKDKDDLLSQLNKRVSKVKAKKKSDLIEESKLSINPINSLKFSNAGHSSSKFQENHLSRKTDCSKASSTSSPSDPRLRHRKIFTSQLTKTFETNYPLTTSPPLISSKLLSEATLTNSQKNKNFNAKQTSEHFISYPFSSKRDSDNTSVPMEVGQSFFQESFVACPRSPVSHNAVYKKPAMPEKGTKLHDLSEEHMSIPATTAPEIDKIIDCPQHTIKCGVTLPTPNDINLFPKESRPYSELKNVKERSKQESKRRRLQKVSNVESNISEKSIVKNSLKNTKRITEASMEVKKKSKGIKVPGIDSKISHTESNFSIGKTKKDLKTRKKGLTKNCDKSLKDIHSDKALLNKRRAILKIWQTAFASSSQIKSSLSVETSSRCDSLLEKNIFENSSRNIPPSKAIQNKCSMTPNSWKSKFASHAQRKSLQTARSNTECFSPIKNVKSLCLCTKEPKRVSAKKLAPTIRRSFKLAKKMFWELCIHLVCSHNLFQLEFENLMTFSKYFKIFFKKSFVRHLIRHANNGLQGFLKYLTPIVFKFLQSVNGTRNIFKNLKPKDNQISHCETESPNFLTLSLQSFNYSYPSSEVQNGSSAHDETTCETTFVEAIDDKNSYSNISSSSDQTGLSFCMESKWRYQAKAAFCDNSITLLSNNDRSISPPSFALDDSELEQDWCLPVPPYLIPLNGPHSDTNLFSKTIHLIDPSVDKSINPPMEYLPTYNNHCIPEPEKVNPLQESTNSVLSEAVQNSNFIPNNITSLDSDTVQKENIYDSNHKISISKPSQPQLKTVLLSMPVLSICDSSSDFSLEQDSNATYSLNSPLETEKETKVFFFNSACMGSERKSCSYPSPGLFKSNCFLKSEKEVTANVIKDSVFLDLNLFKHGGILERYYRHLKGIGDHSVDFDSFTRDVGELNEKELESYNFLRDQLDYHKSLMHGYVSQASDPQMTFNKELIQNIVDQLGYIKGYELASKAILL